MKKIVYSLLVMICISLFILSCVKENTDNENYRIENEILSMYLKNNKITTSPTESGMYFILRDSGSGINPESGDYILINYNIRLLDSDSTLIETNNTQLAWANSVLPSISMGGPFQMKFVPELKQGFKEGLQKMKEGDSATFIIPSKLANGNQTVTNSLGTIKTIPPFSTLIYNIRLLKVIKDIDKYDRDLRKDMVENRFKMIFDDSAKYFLKLNKVGDSVPADSTYVIKYIGYLIDGRQFEKSDSFAFTIGTGVIEGFSAAFRESKLGSRGEIIIPYQYAYGTTGNYRSSTNGYQVAIPPYSSLLFKFEIFKDTIATSK